MGSQTDHDGQVSKKGENRLLGILALGVWVGIVAVPLVLTHDNLYLQVFPASWFEPLEKWGVSPLGLSLGLLAVVVGQLGVIVYHWLHIHNAFGSVVSIQSEGATENQFWEGVRVHLAQPEGFILLILYLAGTWMMNWLPASYYSFEGGIQWHLVFCCLLIQDCMQSVVHLLEHDISMWVYRITHKPHHRFINPRLFDAFNGSFGDTTFMILTPLFVTAWLVPCNVWSYMAFGSLYANWLVLVHSGYSHPWDWFFRLIGFGTAGDHHVHHKEFRFNFGHIFMFWDRIYGTYKTPLDVRSFNRGL